MIAKTLALSMFIAACGGSSELSNAVLDAVLHKAPLVYEAPATLKDGVVKSFPWGVR